MVQYVRIREIAEVRQIMTDKKAKMETEFINAKQVYERYGIVRSMLGALVESGKVERRTIASLGHILNLYKVADIEKVIAGACANV